MKYTTAAVFLPLALGASIDARQATDLKYEVSDFAAACTPESIYCFYEISIVTSNNPDFKQSCDVMGTSDSGELPAVSETQCGTYTISVAQVDDGGLVLTINSRMERLTGTFTISSDDLTTKTSGKKKVQSYTGDTAFSVDINHSSSSSAFASASASASASSAVDSITTASSASSVSSSALSVSLTAASESSTTGTITSSSASPTETNGATRESTLDGILLAVGLMAFVF